MFLEKLFSAPFNLENIQNMLRAFHRKKGKKGKNRKQFFQTKQELHFQKSRKHVCYNNMQFLNEKRRFLT